MEVATESTRNIKSDLNFISSNKGQPLLIMNQYIYKCNKKRSNKKCWVSVVKDCGVNVHTDTNQNYLSGGKTGGAHPKNPESLSFLNT